MNVIDPLWQQSSFLSSAVSSQTTQIHVQKKENNYKKKFTDTLLSEADKTVTEVMESNQDAEASLQLLLDNVYSSGEVLKDSVFLESINNYKKAVKAFINFAVKHIYDVHEQSSGRNILKRKKFIQIEVIDNKLEQLTAEILTGQLPQLNLLARIEEINGMLVDLFS